jgi:hypothetical protein
MTIEQNRKTPVEEVNMKKVLKGIRCEGGFNWLRIDASD